MKPAAFQDLVTILTNDQTPRVWSLLVTVFGELAQDEQARISGALLSKLTSLMGIKPEAMRVALHRLRKDGWIESERHGRTSAYALTDWGRSQSAGATPRIYNHQPLPEQAWLVIFDPNDPTREHEIDGVWVTSTLLITAKSVINNTVFITPLPHTQPLPEWMTRKVCDPMLMQLTHEFQSRLSQLQEAMQNADALDCLEISAMRILIVDGWRRIVLRMPHLPVGVFPPDWLGQCCRESVTALLTLYEKQDLDALMDGL